MLGSCETAVICLARISPMLAPASGSPFWSVTRPEITAPRGKVNVRFVTC